MQQRRLARIVEAEKEQFGMLVGEPEGRERFPDCVIPISECPLTSRTERKHIACRHCWQEVFSWESHLHQSQIHMVGKMYNYWRERTKLLMSLW